MSLRLTFVFVFLVAYCSTPVFRLLAKRFNILDAPGKRKVHRVPVPLLGGLAVYLGILAGFIINFHYLQFLSGVIIGATIILVVGLIDDIRGLSAQIRLVAQVAAAVVVISFGDRLSFLPNTLWGNITEIILTLIWIVGITNAVNYLDGIDGLAAGMSAISAFFFSVISDQYAISSICIVLMASCLGFLPHNLKKNRLREDKIFLGDAGSTLIGFSLACIAIVGNWATDNIVKVTVPVLILGIPIFDMVFTTIMRIREEKISTVLDWLRYGGKDHFHHRLVSLGLIQPEAVLFIYLVNVTLGVSAIMVSNESAIVGILSILQATIIFTAIAVLMVVGRRRRSGWTRDRLNQ